LSARKHRKITNMKRDPESLVKSGERGHGGEGGKTAPLGDSLFGNFQGAKLHVRLKKICRKRSDRFFAHDLEKKKGGGGPDVLNVQRGWGGGKVRNWTRNIPDVD